MLGSRGLNQFNQDLLLIELHRAIEEAAQNSARSLMEGTCRTLMAYPPNWGFTSEESDALAKLRGIANLESALRKVIADAAARPILQVLCIIDGIGDPLGIGWTGVGLLDKQRDEVEGVFLNTDCFEKYWEWRKTRPTKGWKLDIHESNTD